METIFNNGVLITDTNVMINETETKKLFNDMLEYYDNEKTKSYKKQLSDINISKFNKSFFISDKETLISTLNVIKDYENINRSAYHNIYTAYNFAMQNDRLINKIVKYIKDDSKLFDMIFEAIYIIKDRLDINKQKSDHILIKLIKLIMLVANEEEIIDMFKRLGNDFLGYGFGNIIPKTNIGEILEYNTKIYLQNKLLNYIFENVDIKLELNFILPSTIFIKNMDKFNIDYFDMRSNVLFDNDDDYKYLNDEYDFNILTVLNETCGSLSDNIQLEYTLNNLTPKFLYERYLEDKDKDSKTGFILSNNKLMKMIEKYLR